MNTVETLVAARQKIEKPEHWAHSWRELGRHWSWRRFQFVHRYCVMTALSSGDSSEAYMALAHALPSEQADLPLPYFNDLESTTHADILALYDRAIEQASR